MRYRDGLIKNGWRVSSVVAKQAEDTAHKNAYNCDTVKLSWQHIKLAKKAVKHKQEVKLNCSPSTLKKQYTANNTQPNKQYTPI